MSREVAAYTIIALMLFGVVAVVVTSLRYRRYVRRWERGHRNDRKVWKPFWID